MGMFDYVRCDARLPDGWVPDEPMQTKDFDSVMTTLWIKDDGTMWEDHGSHFGTGAGYEEDWQQKDFHGWFEFYGTEDPVKHKGGSKHTGGKRYDLNDNELPPLIWHEYRAKFTDGNLVAILLMKDPD